MQFLDSLHNWNEWAIPIIIRTPPVEEPLSHVGTPLEFPQIFM